MCIEKGKSVKFDVGIVVIRNANRLSFKDVCLLEGAGL